MPRFACLCLLLAVVCTFLPVACTQAPPPAIAEPDPEGRKAELARLQQVIRDGTGDVHSGQELFASRCGTCHQLFDAGEGRAGPDLTPYERGSDSIDSLLQMIAFPDADIHPYHMMFEIRTRDDQILSGVMSERSDEHITLINVAGEELEIARRDVTAERPLYTSLMPDHLLTAMTDQQILDLFTFILSEQPPTGG